MGILALRLFTFLSLLAFTLAHRLATVGTLLLLALLGLALTLGQRLAALRAFLLLVALLLLIILVVVGVLIRIRIFILLLGVLTITTLSLLGGFVALIFLGRFIRQHHNPGLLSGILGKSVLAHVLLLLKIFHAILLCCVGSPLRHHTLSRLGRQLNIVIVIEPIFHSISGSLKIIDDKGISHVDDIKIALIVFVFQIAMESLCRLSHLLLIRQFHCHVLLIVHGDLLTRSFVLHRVIVVGTA